MHNRGTLCASAFMLCLSALHFQARAQTITLGQSADLSGGSANTSKLFVSGARCMFDNVRQSGELKGITFDLVTLDDGGDRKRGFENARKLLDEHKADALFGFTSAAAAELTLPLLEEKKRPMIGVMSGGLPIHQANHPWLFHVRSSYIPEMKLFFAITHGIKTVSVIYNVDAAKNGETFGKLAAEAGLKVAPSVGIDRNSANQKPAAQAVLKESPDAVWIVSTAKATAAVVRELRAGGYPGLIGTSSFAGQELYDILGKEAAGMAVAHAVPNPYRRVLPLTRDAGDKMKKCDVPVTISSFEGFLAAKIVVESVKKTGKSPKDLKTVFESLGSVDLQGFAVSFSPDDHTASQFIDYLIVDREGQPH